MFYVIASTERVRLFPSSVLCNYTDCSQTGLYRLELKLAFAPKPASSPQNTQWYIHMPSVKWIDVVNN